MLVFGVVACSGSAVFAEEARSLAADAKPLSGDSTLAQWKLATPAERSQVAVALARNRLDVKADKLDVAKTAMEINGCLSKTAEDASLGAWKVAQPAATCLDAPEKPGRRGK